MLTLDIVRLNECIMQRHPASYFVIPSWLISHAYSKA